jgi:hypothetical protein
MRTSLLDRNPLVRLIPRFRKLGGWGVAAASCLPFRQLVVIGRTGFGPEYFEIGSGSGFALGLWAGQPDVVNRSPQIWPIQFLSKLLHNFYCINWAKYFFLLKLPKENNSRIHRQKYVKSCHPGQRLLQAYVCRCLYSKCGIGILAWLLLNI